MIYSASPNWGGARNSACRITHTLTYEHCLKLIAACDSAIAINLPFNRFITINWSKMGIHANQGGLATSRLFQLARDWFRVRGFNWTWAYVREAGSKRTNRIDVPTFTNNHLHFLAHIPNGISIDFFKQLRIWIKAIADNKYQKGAIKTKTIGGNLNCFYRNYEHYENNLNKLRYDYILKGATKEAAQKCGLVRYEVGGAIVGKRCGRSNNLSSFKIVNSR